MKKKLVALFVALVLGGTFFAKNYTKGIDLQFGFSIGGTSMTKDLYSDTLIRRELNQGIIEAGGQFKIATYDCFLLNDMLGIYASVGVNLGVFIIGSEINPSGPVGGDDFHGFDEVGFKTSLEFMIGPAFGVNLGGVRFQTGLGFHGVVAWGWYRVESVDYSYGSESHSSLNKVKYTALGFALTPQFRFGASKRCSFILGCDLAFDFPNKLTCEVEHHNEIEFEFDKGFRFGATPYIGLGINF